MLFFYNHSFMCIVFVFFSFFFFFFSSIQNLLNNKAGLGLVFIATLSASGALQRPPWSARRVQCSCARFPGLCKMPVHLSAFARTRGLDRATALGGAERQLGQGEDLVPSLAYAAPGVASHTQCTRLQLGHLLHTHVIGYSPSSRRGFALRAWKLHLPDHLEKEQRWWVGATHEQLWLKMQLVCLARNL